MNLIGTNTCFDIEKDIRSVMAEGHQIVDAGMYVGQKDEVWRDCTIEVNEEKEYSFTYSCLGNHEGSLPPRMALNILSILSKYQEGGVS